MLTHWLIRMESLPAYLMFPSLLTISLFRAVPEIILRGGWAAGTFLYCGGRVFC